MYIFYWIYHVYKYVCSFISRLEKITSITCLVEIVGCTVHMCLLGYYCITVRATYVFARAKITPIFNYSLSVASMNS